MTKISSTLRKFTLNLNLSTAALFRTLPGYQKTFSCSLNAWLLIRYPFDENKTDYVTLDNTHWVAIQHIVLRQNGPFQVTPTFLEYSQRPTRFICHAQQRQQKVSVRYFSTVAGKKWGGCRVVSVLFPHFWNLIHTQHLLNPIMLKFNIHVVLYFAANVALLVRTYLSHKTFRLVCALA